MRRYSGLARRRSTSAAGGIRADLKNAPVAGPAIDPARGESVEDAAKRADAIKVRTREAGGELFVEVDVPGRFLLRGKADLEVRVPRGTRASVTSSNGLVCLSGLRAGVQPLPRGSAIPQASG